MNYLKISVITLILCGMCLTLPISAQINKGLRTDVLIETSIYKISYNEVYEQPNWVEYKVRNIEKKTDRKGMDFYTNDSIHTSDSKDYYNNSWDKGHMAPAATFTDTPENLKLTFSYLNCSLQHYKLNRGEWRFLEAEERVWAQKFGKLEVRVDLHFSNGHIQLPTGGHIPTGYKKHIKFPKGDWKCFYFPNEVPTKDWQEYEVKHTH